ncbi:MAG: hypothetical protein WCP45_16295 [Verrucomicrobiota bacterium]
MKILISLLTLAGTLAWLQAQGPLAPSGAPAPSMKSLSQVEPRTAVQSLAATPPYTISQPGSYYLTGNITVTGGNAIYITASDVTLDLMGFTIESTAAGVDGSAIAVSTVARIKISNGNIKSGSTMSSGVLEAKGFYYGIMGIFLSDCTVTDIRVTGVASHGIWCDQNGVVERCSVTDSDIGIKNPANGVYGSMTRNCSVQNCKTTGIEGSHVEGCYGYGFSTKGISAGLASNCQGRSQTGTGLTATICAQNCGGFSGVGNGMDCTGGTAIGCNAQTVNGPYSLKAKIAIGCVVSTASGPSSGGATDITNRYNMP